MKYEVEPIGFVKNSRTRPTDDYWESITTEIILADHIPDVALSNISAFSHLEIIYLFDQVKEEGIVFSARPRGNPLYPVVGIFGQRKKDRPNRIGLTTVQLLKHEGRSLRVKNLDAIDGTPVLDIKPLFKEFLAKTEIIQPDWVADLMKDYW
jgi:tRNA-Thr(GGU) m(6)t(6)A37 methyltransferase TsaA